jgi:LPS sulfotransferase NodH
MDHRKNRGGHAFSDFTSLETGSERVKGWAKVWREWAAFGFVHFVRYEDLMADPKAALANVCKYFKLEISNEKIQSIIDKHEKNKSRSLNYNKGTVGRFSGELDIQEQKRLTRKLDRLVIEMGYK